MTQKYAQRHGWTGKAETILEYLVAVVSISVLLVKPLASCTKTLQRSHLQLLVLLRRKVNQTQVQIIHSDRLKPREELLNQSC